MKKNKMFKLYIPIFIICVLIIGGGIYFTKDIRYEKNMKKNIHEAALKTINYYRESYKDKSYDGLMDWPALGLYGFGENVSYKNWTINGKNAVYFRQQQVKEGIGLSKVKNTDYERTIIGICAAGKDPRNFGGTNLVKTVKETMLLNGHFADSVEDEETKMPVGEELINAHCFGAIALHAAGEPVPNRDRALTWLEKNQHHDGGFSWDVKYFEDKEDYKKVDSDIDMTAAAIMTFSVLGMDKNYPPVKRALKFLKDNQAEDGGFKSWGAENPESCSWVIQALRMIGENPIGKEWTKQEGCNPVTSLLKYQLKNGSFTHVLDEEDNLPIYDNSMSTYICLYGLADAYNDKGVYDRLYEDNKMKAEKNLFNDFKEGDRLYKEVVELVYDYDIDGYLDGSFKPDKHITKGELSRYLINTLNLKNEFYEKYGMDQIKAAEKEDKYIENEDIENCIDFCIGKGFFKPSNDLNKKGEINKEVKGEEFLKILNLASNSDIKNKDLEFKNFKENEFVTRIQCAESLYKLKKVNR